MLLLVHIEHRNSAVPLLCGASAEVGYFRELFTVIQRTDEREKNTNAHTHTHWHWKWSELQSLWTLQMCCVQLIPSTNISTWQKFVEIHMIQQTQTQTQDEMCSSQWQHYRRDPHFILGQNRMTGNSNFQFESNSSSTSDYLVFLETIKDVLLWNGCCCWWCLFILFSFEFWKEGTSRNKNVNPWEKHKHKTFKVNEFRRN